MESTDDGPPDALRRSPTWLMGQAGIHAQRLLNERMAEAGAHRWHYSVLSALADCGPLSQASLGRHCRLDRSDIAAVVGELEGGGHLVREPDPLDRRRNVVTITAEGDRRLRRLGALAVEAQEDLLAPLDAGERARLIATVERLVEHQAARQGSGWA
ncbi:MarR family winged helix-turn-helix transcriptional regulator [Rhodococcus maanshanensis]|uniref:DNA-binding transcriptional regulator, MarR family n=1 Tax=Rhodococcus maanshanensis TaxID=183556 RepID=A0A1H7PQC9_9NOCA|nr:MarR family winged helix-turn-helix transcriptional regulator [Rhodococcus maanshanensis]SEL37786.1 DNA-binding transcriptional regulator, MarR family [Rhodococcus maanshanensis]